MIKIPELDGVPSEIVEYYVKHGTPGKIVSTRETTLETCSSISICFKDCHWRHVWRNERPKQFTNCVSVSGWWMTTKPVR